MVTHVLPTINTKIRQTLYQSSIHPVLLNLRLTCLNGEVVDNEIWLPPNWTTVDLNVKGNLIVFDKKYNKERKIVKAEYCEILIL